MSWISKGISTKGHHQGAKYLLIKDAKGTPYPLKTELLVGDAATITKPYRTGSLDVINCTDQLSAELVQMLLEKKGLPLYGSPNLDRGPYLNKEHVYNCSWSMIIHDILYNGRQKFMGKSLTYPSGKRIDRNNLYNFIYDGNSGVGNNYINNDEEVEVDDNGIFIVDITLTKIE